MYTIFTPITIGGVEVRNRVVMPAMTTRLADPEGHVTDAQLAYYAARARGGAGLLTVEMGSPERTGRHRRSEIGVYDDKFADGLQRLVEQIHRLGARASIQIGHAGGHTRASICGQTPIAPSAVTHVVEEGGEREIVHPLEASQDRIEETTQAFVEAAIRLQKAGFDCVELHAAHGYLISQFLCPFENRRRDQYGGPLENRAKFGLNIVRRFRNEVSDMPVIFRFSADDFFPGGLAVQDGLNIARWAEEAGAAALHVSAGHYRSLPSAAYMIPPMSYPEATFLDLAAAVKGVVTVPVIAVGRLGDPLLAEGALKDNKADLVALGRPLITDPAWPDKVKRGQPVRRCLACNHCVDTMRSGTSLTCVVNPAAGREQQVARTEESSGEQICVVGAGPAGLSYAHLMAEYNRVTLIEREELPGGNFRLTGKAPLFENVEASEANFLHYIEDMEKACRHKGVRFRYGVNAERAPQALAGYDRVVFATGARYKWGIAPLIGLVLNSRLAKWRLARRLVFYPWVRNCLYYRIRNPSGPRMRKLAHDNQKVAIIGDAAQPGKAKAAIETAFRAAGYEQASSPVLQEGIDV